METDQPLFLVTGSFSYNSQKIHKLIKTIIQNNENSYFIYSFLIKLVVAFTFVTFVYWWSTRNIIVPLKVLKDHVNSVGMEEFVDDNAVNEDDMDFSIVAQRDTMYLNRSTSVKHHRSTIDDGVNYHAGGARRNTTQE